MGSAVGATLALRALESSCCSFEGCFSSRRRKAPKDAANGARHAKQNQAINVAPQNPAGHNQLCAQLAHQEAEADNITPSGATLQGKLHAETLGSVETEAVMQELQAQVAALQSQLEAETTRNAEVVERLESSGRASNEQAKKLMEEFQKKHNELQERLSAGETKWRKMEEKEMAEKEMAGRRGQLLGTENGDNALSNATLDTSISTCSGRFFPTCTSEQLAKLEEELQDRSKEAERFRDERDALQKEIVAIRLRMCAKFKNVKDKLNRGIMLNNNQDEGSCWSGTTCSTAFDLEPSRVLANQMENQGGIYREQWGLPMHWGTPRSPVTLAPAILSPEQTTPTVAVVSLDYSIVTCPPEVSWQADVPGNNERLLPKDPGSVPDDARSPSPCLGTHRVDGRAPSPPPCVPRPIAFPAPGAGRPMTLSRMQRTQELGYKAPHQGGEGRPPQRSHESPPSSLSPPPRGLMTPQPSKPPLSLKCDALGRPDTAFELQESEKKSILQSVPRIVPPVALTSLESPCQSPRMGMRSSGSSSSPYYDLPIKTTCMPGSADAAVPATAASELMGDAETLLRRFQAPTVAASATMSMLGLTSPVQEAVADEFDEKSLTATLSQTGADSSPLPRNSLSLWKLKTGLPELTHADEFSRVSHSAPVQTDMHKERSLPAPQNSMATKAIPRQHCMLDSTARDGTKVPRRVPKAALEHTPPPHINMAVPIVLPPRAKAPASRATARSCSGSKLSRVSPVQVQLATQARAMLGSLPARRST